MEQARKVYVDVTLHHTSDGKKYPLSLVFEDKTYEIDKIKEVRRAASKKTGGGGIRYTIIINGRESYLFEDGRRWFVEAKVTESQ